jgi:hypothetical protein
LIPMTRRALLFALSVLWAFAAFGLPVKDGSLRYEVLLTGKMLDDAKLNAQFIKTLDITYSRFILLSTNDRFYLLGWGGIEPMGQRIAGTISSFAYTSDGLLMVIREKELCHMDRHGNLFRLFGLPSSSMGMAAGKNVMYVYDRRKDRQGSALYAIAKGRKYTKLFEIPAPINSVVEMNNAILFATGSALFSYNIANKDLTPLFALPKNQEIISIAADAASGRIYFSTANSFYVIEGDSAVMISDKFGGVLRYFDNGLIIFDPVKKFLIRAAGLNEMAGVG